MALVAFAGSNANGFYNAATSTSVALTTDTGTAVGDLLIAVLNLNIIPGPTITAPSGWTLGVSISGASDASAYLFWRYADAAGAVSHTFSWTGGAGAVGVIHRYTGSPSLTDPFDGSFVSGVTGAAVVPNLNYTAVSAGLGVWLHSSRLDGPVVGTPVGYTRRTTVTVAGGFLAADRNDAAGALSTGAASTGGSFGPTFLFAGTLKNGPFTPDQGAQNDDATDLMNSYAGMR